LYIDPSNSREKKAKGKGKAAERGKWLGEKRESRAFPWR